MTKQFTKKSLAAALTAAALAFAAVTPVRAADQSEDWFEQQRALTDGIGNIQRDAASPRPDQGARSRVGEPAASPERQASSKQDDWLLQQLRLGEGSAE